MIYQQYLPSPALAKYIRCYWSLESTGVSTAASKDRIFPDGCMELVFHYGDLYKKYHTEDTAGVQPRSFIHGQLTSFMDIEATGRTGIFSVRFHPGGLAPFTAFSLEEVTDIYTSVRNYWGAAGEILEDNILNASTHNERIAILETFLLKKLVGMPSYHPAIEYCVHHIARHHGNVNIDQLAATCNIGRRHLERQFIAGVGLSPKLLARITRFQHVLHLISTGTYRNLTGIAHESGFYDQAHFIRDFRAFTGFNPRQYFSDNWQLARYLSGEI